MMYSKLNVQIFLRDVVSISTMKQYSESLDVINPHNTCLRKVAIVPFYAVKYRTFVHINSRNIITFISISIWSVIYGGNYMFKWFFIHLIPLNFLFFGAPLLIFLLCLG